MHRLVHAGLCCLASAFLLSAGCGGRATTYRLYDGPDRPEGRIAVVSDTDLVQIFRIDGRPAGSDPYGWPSTSDYVGIPHLPRDDFHLEPGPHTLTVRVHSVEVGFEQAALHRGLNAWTIRHDFEAGRRYGFGVEEVGLADLRAGQPVLVEYDGGEHLVARPDVAEQRLLPPETGEGAVVVGQGVARKGTNAEAIVGELNATGSILLLLLDPGPDAGRVSNTIADTRRALRRDKSLPKGVRQTVGYGLGFFEFRDVPPGDHLVVWLADDPNIDGVELAPDRAARVRVTLDDAVIDGVRVDRTVPDALDRPLPG